jgi:predicted small metal-binding protein
MPIKTNMKTLSCKDLGVAGCDFVAKADTAEGAVKMATDHASMAHKEKVDEMAKTMTPEQMHDMMLAKVKDEM